MDLRNYDWQFVIRTEYGGIGDDSGARQMLILEHTVEERIKHVLFCYASIDLSDR